MSEVMEASAPAKSMYPVMVLSSFFSAVLPLRQRENPTMAKGNTRMTLNRYTHNHPRDKNHSAQSSARILYVSNFF